jgi:hypothetical protein
LRRSRGPAAFSRPGATRHGGGAFAGSEGVGPLTHARGESSGCRPGRDSRRAINRHDSSGTDREGVSSRGYHGAGLRPPCHRRSISRLGHWGPSRRCAYPGVVCAYARPLDRKGVTPNHSPPAPAPLVATNHPHTA